ncbi:hypothetical protein [Defluviimonas sp. SAOS-178_SWC]|uniref:hypothetical protein n=1 Tax=Defluviimonas sp. SAOS-178_SWC TaxID=3121287 RepID=UPI003221A930
MTDSGGRALVVATALVWLVMVALSLWNCTTWSVCLFDAPRLPYGPAEARAFLASLGEAARWRYLWVVQPLDLLFPAMLCLSFREVFAQLAPERLAGRLGSLAVIEAGVDYLENALVRAMLKRPDGAFPDILPQAASALTTLKWLLLAMLFAALLRLWLNRKRAPR